MMEHRCYPRFPLLIEVLLYRQGLSIAFVNTLNLSMDGMLVQTERETDYVRNDIFELEIALSIHGEYQRYRIPAFIIHCETGRVGFALEISDEEAREALRTLIDDESAKEIAREIK